MRLGKRSSDDLVRVYRDHVDAVFAFFAYSLNRQGAEDLTSATFEKVLKAWRRYDPTKASERTWIMAIARNVLNDHYRRSVHRDAAVSTDHHPQLLDLEIAPDWEQVVLDADELRALLSPLSERERDVLSLRFGADLPAAEVAALLELSADNVHQISSRALRRLRTVAGPRATS